mgnify:CR=1 FL=1
MKNYQKLRKSMKIYENSLFYRFSMTVHDRVVSVAASRGCVPRCLMTKRMPAVFPDASGPVQEVGGRQRRPLLSANRGYSHLSRIIQYMNIVIIRPGVMIKFFLLII